MSSIALNDWFNGNRLLKGTGMAVGTVISLFSYPTEANIGTAGSRYIQANLNRQSQDSLSSHLKVNIENSVVVPRTTAEDLIRVRSILKPTVSELAKVFGVSRQAIYNWQSGEDPQPIYADKIKDLASAADVIAAESVTLNGLILKRKISNGKTLFEIATNGGSSKEAAQMLVKILRKESEQRKLLASRLQTRAKPTINSYDIGIPLINERA
jgi:transcriptional regulator with XRE-family HTH domain